MVYLERLHEFCEHFLFRAFVHDHIGVAGRIVQAFDLAELHSTRAVGVQFAEGQMDELLTVFVQHALCVNVFVDISKVNM